MLNGAITKQQKGRIRLIPIREGGHGPRGANKPRNPNFNPALAESPSAGAVTSVHDGR